MGRAPGHSQEPTVPRGIASRKVCVQRTVAPPQEPNPLCLDCNYPLPGLAASTRCPECGRPFDPADPRTMNFGRPLGPFARRLLTPVGWPTILLASLSLAGVAVVTRWPGAL